LQKSLTGTYPILLQEEREQVARSETLAIRLSNIANMVLFAAKVYASVRSGSLAIIASTLDSLLDLLSGFILWFTAFSMQTPNPYRYPIGKKRMQPLVSFVTTCALCNSSFGGIYCL
jgi:divalent metal cation (Fe/Co/Zn/Cd) transporter